MLEIDSADGHRYLFKEGAKRKIDDEIERGIEWENLAPLHTPRLIGKAQDKERRAVLREFAEGALLQDILLAPDNDESEVRARCSTAGALIDIWSSTLVARPPRIDYSQQIRTRLREIIRRHPDLEDLAKEELEKYGGIFGALDVLQRKEESARPAVQRLGARRPQRQQRRLRRRHAPGRLHRRPPLALRRLRRRRRRAADVVVPPVPEEEGRAHARPRQRLDGRARSREFAHKNDDAHFDDRLKLARARALITSARLTDDADRAEALFAEGLKYLKKVMRKLKV